MSRSRHDVRLAPVMAMVLLILAFASTSASAGTLSLTASGASGSIGAAFFQQVANQSTGSGVIDPFVRMQHRDWEQGFNTDDRPLNGDLEWVNNSAQFTHSLRFSDFGVVDRSGVASIRFLLDINQQGSSPLLSLDELRVYAADAPDIHANADLASQGALVYDMGADNRIFLDYSLEHGSGSGDMFAYLPETLVSPYRDRYLYLYSKFGATGGDYASNDGFEEWARIDQPATPVPVPEPGSLLLLGLGLISALALRRRS
jgi:hypothetical protein